MIRTLDASMLNLPHAIAELAPLCAQHGIQALSATRALLEDERAAQEASAILADNGLTWGLMPMPADFYHWELDDAAFDEALRTLARQAKAAEKLGVTHAYNHVWPTSPRAFDENFDWHVRRVRAVSSILADHGVRYGLEFLGPHELRTWQPHEFVHTLAGVLAIADAAGGQAGVAFDTDRLVALHLNDAVAGVPVPEQRDMQRRLPMETGVIDSRAILRRFLEQDCDALYMIEPFEPSRTRFAAMTAQQAVQAAADVFARLA